MSGKNGPRQHQGRHRRTRRFVERYKRFVGCQSCGYAKASALAYHHLPGEPKLFGIAEGARCRSLAAIKAEIRKCVVLCHNCHAAEHDAEAL